MKVHSLMSYQEDVVKNILPGNSSHTEDPFNFIVTGFYASLNFLKITVISLCFKVDHFQKLCPRIVGANY